ncbi:MAG TPA: hypothetical protein VGK35_01255 [Actinotalea sp.]
MPRLNPPPNWPTPPTGWTPPAGWEPDPAWGAPPAGWTLWLPEPGDGRRANRTAFGRVGIVAGATWLVVLIVQIALGVASGFNVGSAFGSLLVPWLAVSLVAFFWRKRWNWFAVVGVFLAAWLVLSLVSTAGRLGGAT